MGELGERHETLRTSFGMGEGGGVQRIEEKVRIKVERGEGRWEEAERLAREEGVRGFDLGRGPLMRVKMYEMEGGGQMMMVTMHHIISDGWSMGVMVREFVELYEARREGRQEVGRASGRDRV